MKIGYAQFSPVLGSLELTMKKIDSLLGRAKNADLIVLPELCNSGKTIKSKQQALDLSESIRDSSFINFLADKCKKYSLHVVSGFCERDEDLLYNSAILVNSDGCIGTYRKIHLFLNEKDFFQPGNTGLPVFDLDSYKIGMLICFDWVFPEAWRILSLKGVDIICHPSNLVLPGFCQKSIPSHAIFNHIFIVTANRIGTERDITFTGMSIIANPKGDILVQASQSDEEVGVVDVDISIARDKNITTRNHLFNDRRIDEYHDIVC